MRFPPFRLDVVNQCLWRGEDRISLTPKVFAVLRYLVEHTDRLVSQDELLEAIWPETYVQPEVLRRYILEIRRVLEDPSKNPRFVATFPKRGYQFIAPVTDDTAAEAGGSPGELQSSLVGRGPALAELGGFLEAAIRGQRQIVFVTGEAGIGKTSLADAFQLQCAGKAGVRMARGQCMEGFGGKEAYYPVLDAFGQLMRGPGGEAVIDILAAQAPTWLIQFPGVVKPEAREALQREILGATRERMVREICQALETLAADHPLILVLDDLQWTDTSTLDLISAFARRRGTAKVVLLSTYRPVEVILSGSPLKVLKQDLLIHRLCREISLERLTDLEVEEYLASQFPDNGLPRHLSGLIYRHSDGNPLFMVAMVERLVEKGFVSKESGHWLLSVPLEQFDPGVPETLQQMLEVQLQQLGVPEQRLLRAASVAGRKFSAWAVSAMLNGDAGQAEEVCESLANRHQFIRREAGQELTAGPVYAQYEFRHALYREVLYRQLSVSQRSQLHLRLADKMESLGDTATASGLASHFEEGHDYARAIRYLILAAWNAGRRYALSDSVQVLRHALELLPHIPENARPDLEIEILERISDALYAQGEMAQSADLDRKAAELAAQSGRKAAQVNALTRLARAMAFLDPERCVGICDRALEVSRTHGDPLLEARAEMIAACWRIITNGWRKEDSEICEAARSKIRSLSDELPEYYEILYAHVQCTQGEYEEAYRTAMAGIPKSVENDNLVVYLSAHSSLVQALLHLGRWGELLRVFASALDVVEKNRNAPWLGIFRANLARLHFDAGDVAGARRIAEDLLRTDTEKPASQVRIMALLTAGYAALESGAHDQAMQSFTSVCDREPRPRFFLDWYWRMYGRLGLSRTWLAKGDSVKAAKEGEIFLEAALSGGDPAARALAWDMKTCIAVAGKDWVGARDSLEKALAVLQTVEVPNVSVRVHSTAAELHRSTGDSQAAVHHRERAAEMILKLANSFEQGEPLRDSVLGKLPSFA